MNGDHGIIHILDLYIYITKVKVIENTMKRDGHSPKLFYPVVAKKKLAKDNEKRSCELAADFTHLQLQSIHKIMTLKFALNQTL
ncbi:unnamed protein product [Rotaria sp. Silwood1]|nr:unnamed protein product [Rotaria sp. Silwood1]